MHCRYDIPEGRNTVTSVTLHDCENMAALFLTPVSSAEAQQPSIVQLYYLYLSRKPSIVQC